MDRRPTECPCVVSDLEIFHSYIPQVHLRLPRKSVFFSFFSFGCCCRCLHWHLMAKRMGQDLPIIAYFLPSFVSNCKVHSVSGRDRISVPGTFTSPLGIRNVLNTRVTCYSIRQCVHYGAFVNKSIYFANVSKCDSKMTECLSSLYSNFLCRLKASPSPSARVGNPLFLTPLIEAGRLEEAKNLSRVGPLGTTKDVPSHSGFLTVNKAFDSNLFFWFFPAKVLLQ